MAITARLGGDPALKAVLVILTGIISAVLLTPLLNGLGVRDKSGRGASPPESPRTASTRRVRFRSIRWPVPLPASPWG